MDFVKIADEEKRQILKELGDHPTDIDIKYVSYIRKIPIKQIEQWYEEKKSVDITIDIQLNECEIIGSRKPKVLKSIKIKTETNHSSSFFPLNNDHNKTKEATQQNNQIEQKEFQNQSILIPQQISNPSTQGSKENCLQSQEISNKNHQLNIDNQQIMQQSDIQNESQQKQSNEKVISQNIGQESKFNQFHKSNENLNQCINKVNELTTELNNKYIRQDTQQESQKEQDPLKEASRLSLESIKNKIQISKKQNNALQNTQNPLLNINGEAGTSNQSKQIEKNTQFSKNNKQKILKKQQKISQSQFSSTVFDQNKRNQNNESSINSNQKSNQNVAQQGLDEIRKNKELELQPISLSDSNSLEKNNSYQSKKNQQSSQQVQTPKNNQPTQQQLKFTNFQQVPPLNNFNYQSKAYYPYYPNEQCQPIQHFVSDFNIINSMNQQIVTMNNYFAYQSQVQNLLLQKLEQIINLIKEQQKKS